MTNREKAKHFAPRLRELRKASGLTLKEIAEAVGVSSDAIVKLEGGKRSPSWEVALSLADLFNVKLDSFLQAPTGDEPERKRGRPAKDPKPKEEAEPKRKRGRPRKDES